MVRFVVSVAALVVLISLGACATTIRASSDYYAQADFGSFERYAWMSDMPFIVPTGYEVAVSPLNQRRIKEAVESELAVKGLTLIDDPGSADFVVSLTVGTRDRVDVGAYPVRYRGTWGWRNTFYYYGADVDAHAYTEGTLAIDIFDETTKQPIWHGWATKRITNSDLINAGEQIQAAVKAIFADFPPPTTNTGN